MSTTSPSSILHFRALALSTRLSLYISMTPANQNPTSISLAIDSILETSRDNLHINGIEDEMEGKQENKQDFLEPDAVSQ